MPAGLRRQVAPLTARIDAVTGALAWAATGEQARAEALLRGSSSVRRAVEAAVVLHRPSLAREIVGDDEVLPAATRARLLWEEGHYGAALEAVTDGPTGLHRLIAGDMGVLTPRLPDTAPPANVRVGSVKRVLHLVTTSLPEAQTGYTLRTQGIAAAQQQRGLEVRVVSRIGFPVDQGHLAAPREVGVDGVPYHRLLPVRMLPQRADRRLDLAVDGTLRFARDFRPQVIHAHSKHDNAQVGIRAGRQLGIPVIYEARGFLEETWLARGGNPTTDRYRLTREAEQRCMAAADAVVTISQAMRADITARGIDAAKVHVVPNAVAADFLAEPPPQQQAREELGLDPTDRIVGMAGTLNAYEGLDVLVRAVAGLGDPDVLLLIVGDGPERARLAALARELGVRALLPGRVAHARVRGWVAAMDLYCVPRTPTPVTRLVPPLKPLEALATGVPVLVSDLPPLLEILQAGPVGWTAAAGDVSAWTAEIGRRLYDHSSLQNAGRQGREWVLAERTWQHMAQRYEMIYAMTAGGTTRRKEPEGHE